MTSPDPPEISVYLRPAFELAYRLTGDLDRAAFVAEDGLMQALGSPAGSVALESVFRAVIRASGGSVPPRRVSGPWNFSRPGEELNRDVRFAVAALPLEARAALILREAFEVSREQIGRILEVPEDRVWGLLDTARVGLASPLGRPPSTADVPRWAPSALTARTEGACAATRSVNHDEVDGLAQEVERAEAEQHRVSCPSCVTHKDQMELARRLSSLQDMPTLAESFWRERTHALQNRLDEQGMGDGVGAGRWLAMVLVVLALIAGGPRVAVWLFDGGGESADRTRIDWSRTEPDGESLAPSPREVTAQSRPSPEITPRPSAVSGASPEESPAPKRPRVGRRESAVTKPTAAPADPEPPARSLEEPLPKAAAADSGEPPAPGASTVPTVEELTTMLAELPETQLYGSAFRPMGIP